MDKLSKVLDSISTDKRLHLSHLCLYISIWSIWEKSGHQTPFHTCRKQLLKLSKIKSVATYHRCLNELITSGYIEYRPSFHPKLGSEIILNYT